MSAYNGIFISINELCLKLNKATAVLCKIRHYVNETILRSIYYAVFQSHLSYVCTGWGQNIQYNNQISILQLWELFFSLMLMSIPLSYSQKQKFWNLLNLSTWITVFVNKSVSGSLNSLFSQVYLFANDHNYNTRFASNGLLKILTNNTSIYGTKSFITSTITSWNFFQSFFWQPNYSFD